MENGDLGGLYGRILGAEGFVWFGQNSGEGSADRQEIVRHGSQGWGTYESAWSLRSAQIGLARLV